MNNKRGKSMSDGEVNDEAFKRLIGDLGGIEAEGLFKEDMPQPASGGQLKIEITHSMDGQQTKAKPEIEEEDDDEREHAELGK